MTNKIDKRLLELRNIKKGEKPKFLRQQGMSIKSLSKKWRAPRGMHSKLRKKLRGKGKHPSMGYSSPTSVRGLHKSGLIPFLVHNISELERLNAEYGVVVGSTVGQKKRIQILKRSKELKLSVLNVKNVDGYISSAEEKLKSRIERKKSKVKEKPEEKIEKKEASGEASEEEKEKQAKEEKKKILESRR
ncbi:MAG: 50S ribosomal protein L32e [Nanoarchaeota archaeon]